MTRWRAILGVIAALTCAAMAAATFVAHDLTKSANTIVGAPPSDIAAAVVSIPDQGHSVAGWIVDSPQAKGAVLLLHGVRGNRNEMAHRIRLFRDADFTVLAIDMAGHGETLHPRITFGHFESRSAHAAVRFLRERLPGLKVAVVGMSLGGAAAVLGKAPVQADAVVLEAVYADIRNATADRIEMMLGKIARPLQAPLVFAASWLLGVDPAQLRPVDAIAQLKAPVLVVAGAQDIHTPIADSRLLFDRANAPKEFWVIDDAAHVDFAQHVPNAYRQRVVDFIERSFAAR